MSTGIYKPVIGLDGRYFIGPVMAANPNVEMLRVTAPQISLNWDTEEMGIFATELFKAYVQGELDFGVQFTVRRFKVDDADPPEIAILRAALASGGAFSMKLIDTAMGTLLADFIVQSIAENRVKGQVMSWEVQTQPTYYGRLPAFTAAE